MKFGALKFTSTNIGDEIQSIAAQRFLPKIDYYIFREQLSNFKSSEKVKLIMNSWYMWKPQNFPPSNSIEPLLVSMYFNPDCRKRILTKDSVSFFHKYGPVGCRDLSTQRWFEENGIPAYFSGCLTTTLIPNETIRKNNPHKYVLCVDCSDNICDYVKSKSIYPVYSFNKLLSPYIESLDRMVLAKVVLFMYHNAHCVITSNLHTALPCLAFGTRVCLLKKEYEISNGIGRFDGMESFFNWQTEDSFINNGYDFNYPMDNPKNYEGIRYSLIEKCKSFTGYDSEKPTIEDDFEPVHELISMLALNDKNIKRTLYWAGKKDLLKMIYLKAVKKADMYDIDSDEYLQIRKK